MDPTKVETIGKVRAFINGILWIEYKDLEVKEIVDDAVGIVNDHSVIVGIEIKGLQVFANPHKCKDSIGREIIAAMRGY